MAKFKLEDGTEIEAFTSEEVKSMIGSEVAGLKAKRDELLGVHAKEKEKLQALEEAQRVAEEERQRANGEFEKLSNNLKTELETEKENNRKYRQEVQAGALELAAASFDSLAVDESSVRHLRADVKSYAKHDGKKVFYEINGVEATIDEVREKVIADNPRLVVGSQANGGGAQGAAKQALGVKKASEYTEAERVSLYKEDPVKFKEIFN